jgi:hypothetical protein
MSSVREIGLEKRDGYDVGRDPRTMSVTDLSEAGHDRISRGKAMRIKCLDCCGDSANEVRLCVAVDCALWPFRMGTDPWRAPVSEARMEHARQMGMKRAAERSTPLNGKGNPSALPVQAPTLPNGIPAEKSKENRWGNPKGGK